MNQCQGCMAGWEKLTPKPMFKGDHSWPIHIVEGGYKGEVVGCTAYLYEDEDDEDKACL